MSNYQARELNKVRLEPARPVEDADDELESDPSDDGEGVEFDIDAVCWAEYKDSTFERANGKIGWHYYVMWQGYLKTGSDTVETRSSFVDDPDDPTETSDALLEFWASVPAKKVRKGKDEPGGKIGEIRFASDDLLRRKFKDGKPKRNFAAYKRRLEAFKEARKAGFERALVYKRDSDYYIRKKRKALLAAEKEAAGSAQTQPIPKKSRAPEPEPEPVAGPSRTRERSSSSDEPLAGKRHHAKNGVNEMPPPALTPSRPAPTPVGESPAPGRSRARSFDSLFDEASQPSNSQPQASARKRTSETPRGSPDKRGSKRRRVVDSPPSSPGEDQGKAAAEAPRFELDTSIFGATSPQTSPSRQRAQPPLFDFGEDAPTPQTVPTTQMAPGITLQVPTPAKPMEARPVRSDDPDEEEEELEIQEIEPPPLAKPNSPISVADSEEEVVAEIAPADDGPAPHAQAPGSPPLGDFIPFPNSSSEGSPSPPHSPRRLDRGNRDGAAESGSMSNHEGVRLAANSARPAALAAPPALLTTQAASGPPAAPNPPRPAPALAAAVAPPAAPMALGVSPTPAATHPEKPGLAVITQNAEAGHSHASAWSETPLSATPTSATVRPKQLPTALKDRPKYQQPSRIQLLDLAVDPSRDPSVRHLPPARRFSASQMSPTAPQPQALPAVGPSHSAGAVSSVATSAYHSTARPPVAAPPPQPHPAPPTRRTWAAPPLAPPQRPPNGQPSWAGGTSPLSGSSRPQYGSFSGGVSPQGGVSPYGQSNRSPYQGGASPANGLKSPNAQAGFGGRSPNYSAPVPGGRPSISSAPQPPSHQGSISGPSQQSRPQPQQPVAQAQRPPSQPPAIIPSTGLYEARRDPRLRRAAAAPGPSTVVPPPPPPDETQPPTSTIVSAVKASPTLADTHPLCTLRVAHVEGAADNYVSLNLLSGWASDASFLLEKHIDAQHVYLFQEVDRRCLQLCLIQGAHIIEWAQAEPPAQPTATWASLQRKMDQRRSILVFLDEVRAANQPVTSHNILMLARAEELRVGVDLNLNGWKLDRLNYVAFIVKVPIRPNAKIDILPNPLRPFVPGEESPPSIGPRRVDSIAASFGFDDKTASELGQQKTLSVIPANLSRTVMYNELVHIASKCGVKPDKDVPETVLVLNGFFQSATMSRLFRRTLTKKTQYMSIGADLNSLISRWALRPIWKTGGLVTFSPTFFLFQHDRLNDIMKVVRSAPNWAAYIVPTTLLYVDEAIEQNKALDPNSAFAALTRALFLDDNNRRIAGEISSDTGGIVVSAAPPLLALKQPCEKWVKWLDDIFACTEHAPLLDLCRQWARTWGHRQTGLTIEEVEKISIGDMIKMRTLPHVVPYRRCIYVGSINDDLIREAHASGIDVISPDAFFSTYMASV